MLRRIGFEEGDPRRLHRRQWAVGHLTRRALRSGRRQRDARRDQNHADDAVTMIGRQLQSPVARTGQAHHDRTVGACRIQNRESVGHLFEGS